MLPDIVTTHIDQLTNEFIESRAHLLKDDLSQDDYDTFCTFLKKNGRCVLGTCAWPLDRERVSPRGGNVGRSGQPDTCHSKDP
jgi:hypothetical protein